MGAAGLTVSGPRDAASVRRAPLVAVHTWDGSVIAELVDWQSAAVEAEEELAERLAGWGAKYPDVAVQRVVGRASAARALLDESTQAQLVVVGSRGHGEITGLLLHSVSNALVHAAGCPVAIVRSGD
jgi:nucleotide-binding universal stress UspA family protein